MKLKCRHCGTIVDRDMRQKSSKHFMTKRGYRSYCEHTGKDTFLTPIKRVPEAHAVILPGLSRTERAK